MNNAPSCSDTSSEWIALPGLFDASELADAPDLEVRALPLLLVDGRVYYGVYARERAAAARAKSAA